MTISYGKQLDSTYPHKLLKIGIKLMEPFRGAKSHHQLKCNHCNHRWIATPISKMQAYKKYGFNGCPSCNEQRKDQQKEEQLQKDIINLNNRNIQVLSKIKPGMLHVTTIKVTFKNTQCGHTFETYPGNVIHKNIDCPICGIETRKAQLTQTSKDRSDLYQLTATEWQKFKSKVYSLTRESYTTHKSNINPTNLKRGKAGVDGAHHLDHIVPVRYCFNHNIPAELCAHHENLQMLHWRANVGSRDKLKHNITIPHILQEYIQ